MADLSDSDEDLEPKSKRVRKNRNEFQTIQLGKHTLKIVPSHLKMSATACSVPDNIRKELKGGLTNTISSDEYIQRMMERGYK